MTRGVYPQALTKTLVAGATKNMRFILRALDLAIRSLDHVSLKALRGRLLARQSSYEQDLVSRSTWGSLAETGRWRIGLEIVSKVATIVLCRVHAGSALGETRVPRVTELYTAD